MATLQLEEVEFYAKQLLDAGILTQGDYNDLWAAERRAMREGDGNAMTEQDVTNAVNQMALRNTEMERFQQLSEEVGTTVTLGEWESVRAALGRDHPGFWDNFGAGVSFLTGGVRDALTLGEGVEYPVPGGNQMLNDLNRALKEQGHATVPIPAFHEAETMDDVMKIFMERTNLTPADFQQAMVYVEELAIQREQDAVDLDQDLAANEEIDRRNIENPEYARNLGAFEILERNSPTKFQFDETTGAIYMTDGTGQVDRSGNIVQAGSAKAADLVGGWDVGGEPDFTDYEGFDGEANGLAFGKQTGWGKMSEETDTVVTEAMYMDVLDVINNKGMYGADASRYLAGAGSFLGGYDSTYRVKVEETEAMRRGRTWLKKEQLGNNILQQGFVADMKRWTSQQLRRPMYDKNDNWAQFAGMSPENVAAVQSRMIAVGALDADEVVQGVWGPAEAEQMFVWMDVANAKGLTWQNVDEDLLRQMFEEQGASAKRAAFVPDAYRPMDPARVEMTVKDSIRQMLGRDATSEDLQQLGGYLTDMHSASYEADVKAARATYDQRVTLDESGGQFGQPGAVQDVDYEARYIQEMEKRFTPQLESQERGVLAGKQQDMGVAMSNLMGKLGAGI